MPWESASCARALAASHPPFPANKAHTAASHFQGMPCSRAAAPSCPSLLPSPPALQGPPLVAGDQHRGAGADAAGAGLPAQPDKQAGTHTGLRHQFPPTHRPPALDPTPPHPTTTTPHTTLTLQVDDEIEGLAGLDDEAEYQRFLQASVRQGAGAVRALCTLRGQLMGLNVAVQAAVLLPRLWLAIALLRRWA